MSRSTRISRRTVLRGLGATISLPLLEAMLPATSRAANAQRSQASGPYGFSLRAQRHAHARLDAC